MGESVKAFDEPKYLSLFIKNKQLKIVNILRITYGDKIPWESVLIVFELILFLEWAKNIIHKYFYRNANIMQVKDKQMTTRITVEMKNYFDDNNDFEEEA